MVITEFYCYIDSTKGTNSLTFFLRVEGTLGSKMTQTCKEEENKTKQSSVSGPFLVYLSLGSEIIAGM